MERLVRTWMASGRDDEIEAAASEIASGKTSLLDFVKALGEYLTSEEAHLRTKGVECLSSVLSRCPPEKHTRQSVRVLVTFYCDKLDDAETIIPALKGLSLLASLSSFGDNETRTTLRGLFTHVKMKSLTASSRLVVFTIIDTLMARQRDVLKEMENEFMSGYIRLTDGEKDPRNLIMAFAIIRVLLIEFKIDNFVEALFNITFCYFPITFKQPTDDPYGITTDMLKDGLLSCLNATSAFGPLAIPVFVEKLTAGYRATKIDTLCAISSCLPIYGATLAGSSARKLWSAIKLEVFHPTDPTVEDQALCTIQDLIKTIYMEQEGDIQGFAQDICAECIQILREPEKSQAKSAMKIICALVTTTTPICRYTLSQVVPHLVNLFFSLDEIDSRSHILLMLSDLIFSTQSQDKDMHVLSKDSGPLFLFKDELFNAVVAGLKTPSTRTPALKVLRHMLANRDLLTAEETSFVISRINEILFDDLDDGESSDAALDLLSAISASNTRLLLEQTLPPLFALLPDQAPMRDATSERAMCWRILCILRQICLPAELFEVLVIRLTAKLDHLSISGATMREDAEIESSVAYAHSILATLLKTLGARIDMKYLDIPKYMHSLVPRLFRLFINSAILPESDRMTASDARLVGLAAQIITLVVQTQSLESQEAFGNNLFLAYLKGEIQGITDLQRASCNVQFKPFDDSSSTPQKNLVSMFAAAVIGFRRETPMPIPDLCGFLNMLVTWSMTQADNELQRCAAWQIIASIVNKKLEDVDSFLSHQMKCTWPQEIADKTRDMDSRRHGISLWRWISRALLVRDTPLSVQFINHFFDAFDDKDIDWCAAKALGDVCRNDSVLTKSNHAVIKLLCVQKFVSAILPRLIDNAESTTETRRNASHLVVLTFLIQPIPKAIYAYRMASLIPLLLRALDLPDDDLRANVIDILAASAENELQKPSFTSEHASTLVSAMLKNSRIQNMPSARVRIAALRYLSLLPSHVRYDILHPCKAVTIRELGKILDDPKRSVRKEAVEARTNWFKYHG